MLSCRPERRRKGEQHLFLFELEIALVKGILQSLHSFRMTRLHLIVKLIN